MKTRYLLASLSALIALSACNQPGKTENPAETATNGKEVMAAIDRQPFDLVFLDIQMPEMDGYEATQTIRAQEMHTGRHLPIIAMTANAMVGDREKCLEAGACDYLSKPVSLPMLKASLIRWIAPAAPAEPR